MLRYNVMGSVRNVLLSVHSNYSSHSHWQPSRRRFPSILGGLFRDEVHTPQQCLGPECVFAARPHSKYCSEECGVKLAMK